MFENPQLNKTKQNIKAIMENDDLCIYMIVHLSATSLEAMGYDRDFIPKFQLLGADAVYTIPMNMIVGPLIW